jgi:hypothetical protein
MYKKLENQKTALNRTVTASPPYGGSGYTKTQSGLCPFVRFCVATFFCARKNATHFFLSGAKKRQLQPERYVPFQWVDIDVLLI